MSKQKRSTIRRIRNLSLAGILGLVGCMTMVIALSALLIGLWIDSFFGQRGPATVLMLVISIPLSLFLMVRITLWLTGKLDPPTITHVEKKFPQEEEE